MLLVMFKLILWDLKSYFFVVTMKVLLWSFISRELIERNILNLICCEKSNPQTFISMYIGFNCIQELEHSGYL